MNEGKKPRKKIKKEKKIGGGEYKPLYFLKKEGRNKQTNKKERKRKDVKKK